MWQQIKIYVKSEETEALEQKLLRAGAISISYLDAKDQPIQLHDRASYALAFRRGGARCPRLRQVRRLRAGRCRAVPHHVDVPHPREPDDELPCARAWCGGAHTQPCWRRRAGSRPSIRGLALQGIGAKRAGEAVSRGALSSSRGRRGVRIRGSDDQVGQV